MVEPSVSATPDQPVWTPPPGRVAAANIGGLARHLGEDEDFSAVHRFSLDQPGRFWQAVWDHSDVIGDPGDVAFKPGPVESPVASGRFFPNANVNVAQNLLRRSDDTEAVVSIAENGERRHLSWADLHRSVAAAQAGLRRAGIGPGDTVVALLPNSIEAVVLFLATSATGAVFSSCSPDFGAQGVIDRFGQLKPKLFVACDGYRYNRKSYGCLDKVETITNAIDSLTTTVVVSNLIRGVQPESLPGNARSWAAFIDPTDDDGEDNAPASVDFVPGSFDAACVVLFSSGTTGAPKAIVHRAGGLLLKLTTEHQYHLDVSPGDRLLYYTTTGWMMWNWLVFALAAEATIIVYDGSPVVPAVDSLFAIAAEEELTLLGVSAKYLSTIEKKGVHIGAENLPTLRTLCSTGSPLSPASFRYVYSHLSDSVHLASISGGTDLCGCLLLADPTAPVYAGELQRPALGLDIDVFDQSGRPTGVDEAGELVCRTPFPTVPLAFINDDEGERMNKTYFVRFRGLWHQGDYATKTRNGGWTILGRSDATLNAGGIRIGTAEIYRAVEQVKGISEALAVTQAWEDDRRIVLFVRPNAGVTVTEELRSTIRATIRAKASPRHMPAVIISVSDLPRTRSGKISELVVRDLVDGKAPRTVDALANPEVLDEFVDRPELAKTTADGGQ